MPRHFAILPWDRPLLPQAVGYLAAGWTGGALDLSGTLVAVPTRQAGRRLREALAVHAASRGSAVLAPRVIVAEQLLELAADPETRAASRAQALLAWAAVLRSVDLGSVRAVFPVDPPRRNLPWALLLADEMLRLQRELAEGGLRFGGVAEHAGPDFAETERWIQLAGLERRVDTQMAARGLVAPETAKLAAAARPGPVPAGVVRIVLLAVADPLPLALRVLEAWSRSAEVEVVAFGPSDGAACFDGWGRPLTDAWNGRLLELPDFEQRVHVCADPVAQAQRVVQWACGCSGRSGALGLGCADASAQTALVAGLAQAGVRTYLPAGVPLRQNELMGVLDTLRAAVREDSWRSVARLVRRPEILDWLASEPPAGFSSTRLLAALDELHARHLPADLAAARRHAAADPAFAETSVVAALERIESLLNALRAGAFPAAWMAALGRLFARRELDLADPVDRAFAEAARSWREVVESVSAAMPPGSPAEEAEALAWQLLGEIVHYEEKPAEALELNGWLELVFCDEPHLVVAGCNDGAVPKAVTGHPFLPEALRERLGLKTNAQRFACDAWQLAALAACRAEHGRLDLLLGRASAAGDPLRPSRLLFRCGDPELPKRVAFLFRDPPPPANNPPWRRAWALRPPWLPPPTSLRVTAFRDYLRCPFRFHLRHVLKMEPVEAEKRELDRRDFGVLLHGVLEQLGRDPAWGGCTDERAMAEAFSSELDRRVEVLLGADLSVPLRVQVESARQRLVQAARIQAAERAAGWAIVHTEWRFPRERLGLGELTVTGTIDRIERNEFTGQWRVLDYKSAESASVPAKAHLGGAASDGLAEAHVTVDGRARTWKDLQLPLYRWAVGEALGADDVVLGYFNLPKAVTETAIAPWADYDPALHESALACARAVATAVRSGRFWPPREDVRGDEFAGLIHNGAAGSFDVAAWPETEVGR